MDAIPIIMIVLCLMILYTSKQSSKHAYRAGYWRGKADFWESMQQAGEDGEEPDVWLRRVIAEDQARMAMELSEGALWRWRSKRRTTA